MTPQCDHSCFACVKESGCDRKHALSLGVCARHLMQWVADAIEAGAELPPAIVGAVMARSGGRANPNALAAVIKSITR